MKWKHYAIKRKYVEIISNIYEQFGFPPLVIETEISAEDPIKSMKNF